jgi:hypothetical protein
MKEKVDETGLEKFALEEMSHVFHLLAELESLKLLEMHDKEYLYANYN